MKKKNILLILGLLPVLSSCITKSLISETSGVSSSELNIIPNGANEIIIERSGTAEELYNDIFTALLSRGHRIDSDDKERGDITTEGQVVGQYTTQRMTNELTEYEIELFKKFRELQTDIEILNDNDFFSFRNGSITVHKNNDGNIMKIEKNFISFRRA